MCIKGVFPNISLYKDLLNFRSLANFRGYPGLMADDYVLVKCSTKPIEQACESIYDNADVFRNLRIQRLARRLTLAVGNDPHTPSGQAAPETRGPLVAAFGADLTDLEASLKPPPVSGSVSGRQDDRSRVPQKQLPAPSPVVAVRLLETKLHLYTFELQDEAAGASREDLLTCYTSSMRIVKTLEELHTDPESRANFWSRSLHGTFVAAIVSSLCHCLLAHS